MKCIRCFLVAVLVAVVPMVAPSQGMPVFDMSNFMQAVLTVSQTYNQYRAQIEQLKYQFESAKAQLQSIATADIDSFRDAVEFADSNLSYLRTTEAAFKRMGIEVDGRTYALDELYMLPGAMAEEAFGQEFSDAEKARIWQQYGLQPANYFYAQKLKQNATETFGKATAFALMDEEQEYTEDLARAVGDLADQSSAEDSSHAVAQYTSQQLAGMSSQLAALQITMQEQLKVMAAQGQLYLEANSSPYTLPDDPTEPYDPENAISDLFLEDIVG